MLGIERARSWWRLGLLSGALLTLMACQVVVLGGVAEWLDPLESGGEACAFWHRISGKCCPDSVQPKSKDLDAVPSFRAFLAEPHEQAVPGQYRHGGLLPDAIRPVSLPSTRQVTVALLPFSRLS